MLVLDGYDVAETKYHGGMQIIVKFKCEKAARIFKANKLLWLKWLNSIYFLGDKSIRFERITWIKITSLLFLLGTNQTLLLLQGTLERFWLTSVLFRTSPTSLTGNYASLLQIREKSTTK